MDHFLRTSASIIIESSKEKTWRALVTPELIAKYLYGTETITTWEVGSEIVFQGEYEDWKYTDKGEIRAFKPNQELSYSYWAQFNNLDDTPENYSLVTIKIKPTEEKNKVELVWSQAGYKDKSNRDRSQEGLGDLLNRVKAVIEG